MPEDQDNLPVLEIAHVLFIDIVSYSCQSMEEQRLLVGKLRDAVQSTEAFRSAKEAGQLLTLPTGDGMALVFSGDPVAPVLCATELARLLRSHADLRVRMGVHIGPVFRVQDINTNMNVAGGGVNVAQRVMDCGDAGHILVSSQVADVLQQLRPWATALHEIGVVRVKHGLGIRLFNLCGADFGNPSRPQKVRRSRTRSLAWTGAAVLGAVLVAASLLTTTSTTQEQQVLRWWSDIGSLSVSATGDNIAFDSDITGQREIYVVLREGGTPSLRTSGPGDKSEPRFDPTGEEILYCVAGEHAEIWEVPTLGGNAQELVSDATSADWSPDSGSKTIAYARQVTGAPASLWVRDLSDGHEVRIFTSRFSGIDHVRWSPKGDSIFFSDGDGAKLIRADGKGGVRRLPDDVDRSDTEWSADGRYLYYSKRRKASHASIWRFRIPDGRTEEVLRGLGDSFCPVPLRAGGGLIFAHGHEERELYVRSLSSGETKELTKTGWASEPSVSPRGDNIVFLRDEADGKERVCVVTPNGQQTYATSEALYDSPSWSSDGAQIAYAFAGSPRDYYHILVGPLDFETATQETHGDSDDTPDDWSRDGKALVFTRSAKGRTALASLNLKDHRVELVTGGNGLDSGSYSPNGHWLLAVGATDLADRRGMWVLNVDSDRWTRLTEDPVAYARWVRGGTAIVFTLTQKSRGKLGLWELPFADGKPAGGPSVIGRFPGSGDIGTDWGTDDSLSFLVFARTRDQADLYEQARQPWWVTVLPARW